MSPRQTRPAEPATCTVGYYYDGVYETLCVHPDALGKDVRNALSRELNLTYKLTHVILLKKTKDGKWPTQDSAPSASGVPLRYLETIQGKLENLPLVDAI